MVFAGEADDPGTLQALAGMGYKRPEAVIAGVRGWHHGRYPAVRTPRARELLTEVQPLLIEALAKTADPDLAFIGFDRFLSELPSSVQLFSLLKQHPRPARADRRHHGHRSAAGPHPEQAPPRARRRAGARLLRQRAQRGATFRPSSPPSCKAPTDFQEALDRARLIGHEQAFLIGVRVLTGTISAAQAGDAYALLAECMIAGHAGRGRARDGAHARPRGGRRRGCRGHGQARRPRDDGRLRPRPHRGLRLCIADAQASNGLKPLPATQYYTRLTQRLISALASQTAEGNLYEVDMRLRPSGQKGPVATQLSSFIDYQQREAWTWEHLALTRARVVSGPPALQPAVEAGRSGRSSPCPATAPRSPPTCATCAPASRRRRAPRTSGT